jgi:hypothetical protein
VRTWAFRYTPPKGPVAGAVTGVGKVAISVRLGFDGELDVVRHRDSTRKQASAETLSILLDGLLISRLDSVSPSILTPPSRRFVQTSQGFLRPETMVYQGECLVEIRGETLDAEGILSYRLDVVARWNGRAAGLLPPESEAGWSEFFGAALASIGGLMLGELPAR